MTTVQVFKVAARYWDKTAGDVWLPSLLGSKERIVTEILAAIKKMPAPPLGAKNIKALAGGVCYLLLKEVGAPQAAEKLWNLLDASAGLDPSPEVQTLVWRVSPHLAGPDRKLHAAAVGVALLQRTRQQRKAEKANAILAHLFARDVTEAAPPETGGAKTPTQAFAEFVEKQTALAKQVAHKVKGDPALAAVIVVNVLEDVNAHSESSIAETILSPLESNDAENYDKARQEQSRLYVSDISSDLDYGVIEAGAFGVALMTAVGQPQYAAKLQRAMVQEFKDHLGPGTLFVARQRRQRGISKIKSKQYYRKNRAKIRRLSKQWRNTHKSQLKRYQRLRKIQPGMHKRRMADDVSLETLDINFWDVSKDKPGEVEGLDLDNAEVKTKLDGEPQSYDLYDFLDNAAVVFEDDEKSLINTLDELHELTPDEIVEWEADQDEDVHTASYDRMADVGYEPLTPEEVDRGIEHAVRGVPGARLTKRKIVPYPATPGSFSSSYEVTWEGVKTQIGISFHPDHGAWFQAGSVWPNGRREKTLDEHPKRHSQYGILLESVLSHLHERKPGPF